VVKKLAAVRLLRYRAHIFPKRGILQIILSDLILHVRRTTLKVKSLIVRGLVVWR
jgi:hypothetical protein